ncbi:hypothetical protein EON80_04965 [bacterium]|nr:MAG: hypothetical protein EON80_04965 [bacterium]
MEFYADMRQINDGVQGALPIYAVGWLGKETNYPRGNLGKELQDKIEAACEACPVAVERGFAICSFCRSVRGGLFHDPGDIETTFSYSHISNSSLLLPGQECYFYAPSLISHYIAFHQYLPPVEFVNALKVLDLEAWKEVYEAAYAQVYDYNFRWPSI